MVYCLSMVSPDHFGFHSPSLRSRFSSIFSLNTRSEIGGSTHLVSPLGCGYEDVGISVEEHYSAYFHDNEATKTDLSACFRCFLNARHSPLSGCGIWTLVMVSKMFTIIIVLLKLIMAVKQMRHVTEMPWSHDVPSLHLDVLKRS